MSLGDSSCIENGGICREVALCVLHFPDAGDFGMSF